LRESPPLVTFIHVAVFCGVTECWADSVNYYRLPVSSIEMFHYAVYSEGVFKSNTYEHIVLYLYEMEFITEVKVTMSLN
jgi:hypothetical protein